jgi:hypothetical protein
VSFCYRPRQRRLEGAVPRKAGAGSRPVWLCRSTRIGPPAEPWQPAGGAPAEPVDDQALIRWICGAMIGVSFVW